MKIISVTLTILMPAILLLSCQKKEIDEMGQSEHNKTAITTHFIDDISVSEVKFKNQPTDIFIVEIHKPLSITKNNTDEILIEKRAYTTREQYIELGKEYGYEFKKQLVLEEMMSEFAKKSGAITEFEKTGELPMWYLEREQFVYDSLFNSDSNLKIAPKSLFTTLYKEYFTQGAGAGSSIIMLKTLPLMYPGWNNKVSCVEFVGIGGCLIIYDRTFYRKRLTTIVNWGMTHINLSSGVNNRMSSGILLF